MTHPVRTVFFIQAFIATSVIVFGYGFCGVGCAGSAVVGATVAIIPQSFFGYWVFRKHGARNAQKIARSFYIGEVLKLGITALLFAIVWTIIPDLEASAVVTSFVITIVAAQLSLPFMVNGL